MPWSWEAGREDAGEVHGCRACGFKDQNERLLSSYMRTSHEPGASSDAKY